MTEPGLPLLIPTDHPAYVGHFPGQPILPGVVLLDQALRAVASREGLPLAFTTIRSAKFPNPVGVGDALRLNYVATAEAVFRFEVLAGERLAGERLVASGVLAFTTNCPGGGIS